MTEKELRAKVVSIAEKYLGCKESNGSHRKIIDLYNSHKPLARGYPVKYTDAWCATFVSAVFIEAGLTEIAPTECGCGAMINLYKKIGRWEENDAYVPSPGDVVMYDWQDNGVGDNTGAADHVGIVASVSGNSIKVIEGNMSDAVGYRTLRVNGKYIRGYCLPKYAAKAGSTGSNTTTPPSNGSASKPASAKKAAEAARSFNKTLAGKVNDLVTAGGEPNKLEGIKVNGTLLALTDKIADILIAEGKTNGTISANGVDIPVHGLAALAYKSEVAESDLAAALKAIIDAKAKQADLDTLTGDGEGSISKMIDAAINKFATDVTDDNVVNSYKELIDWVAKHGPEATKMAGGISDNKTAIADLKTLIGTLPEGATSTTVVAYITEAINALSIGDYAKMTEVTAAINAALESYYTKTQVDETFVKKTDIVMATDEEVDAMLTEVFGAQATV